MLEAAASSSPSSATCVSDQDARPRDLVRGIERVPHLRRPPERDECLPRLALGEVNRAPRMSDERAEHRALVPGRDLLELVAGTARGFDVPRRHHDLDEGRKQPSAVERRGRGRLCPPDRRDGSVGAALRESQLGEPGLRLPAERARLSVGIRRAGEVALQPKELALPVAREPGRGIARLDEALAGSARLLERISPRAVELEDLRAVHEQRPVNATMSGWSAHQSASARVHSRARRTSYTSWQARITPQ